MTESLRDRLRSLHPFPKQLPTFNPVDVPGAPQELFLAWLTDAIDAKVPAPHAMTLSTSGADGGMSARVLILKDVDERGWCFATGSESPKARGIEHDPRVALTFFWPQLGRQIRVTGAALRLPQDDADRDFLARTKEARAATLVGRQSEPLAASEEYDAAFARALERVREHPGLVASGWAVYSVRAEEVEFWQASHDRAHLRLRYRLQGQRWTSELLWP